MADHILARSRSLLLRSIKSEVVSLAAHKSNVWACPFGVLSLREDAPFPLKNGDMYGYLCCIGCFDLGGYGSRRSRVRPNTDRDFSARRRLVGRMESADNCLGVLSWRVAVDRFLTRIHIDVGKKPMEDESYRSQSEPKGHFPCSNKMAEVRLVNIREVAHA